VPIAADLLAWFKLLGCHGELARAETEDAALPVAGTGRITRGQRRRRLCLPRHWPWSHVLAAAIEAIARIPLLAD
jgi:hypothetical protein